MSTVYIKEWQMSTADISVAVRKQTYLHQWCSVPHHHDATSPSELPTSTATCDCLARASERDRGHPHAALHVDVELSALSQHVVVMLHAVLALVVHLQVYYSLPLQEQERLHFNNATNQSLPLLHLIFVQPPIFQHFRLWWVLLGTTKINMWQ